MARIWTGYTGLTFLIASTLFTQGCGDDYIIDGAVKNIGTCGTFPLCHVVQRITGGRTPTPSDGVPIPVGSGNTAPIPGPGETRIGGNVFIGNKSGTTVVDGREITIPLPVNRGGPEDSSGNDPSGGE